MRSLLHSSGALLVCSLLFRAFVGPLVCSLFHSCIRKLIRWCVRELVRFYVLLFVRWFIRAITRFLCIRSFVGALVRTLFVFRAVVRSLACTGVKGRFFFFKLI